MRQQPKPIKSSFSWSFQIKYCLFMAMVSVCVTLALYFYLDTSLGGTYMESLRILQRLELSLPFYLSVGFVVQLGFILLLTVVINTFVSHEIAGPVYRYEDSLERISRGDLRHDTVTRQKDQLKPMVNCLNEFVASVRVIFGGVRELHDKVGLPPNPSSRCEAADLQALGLQIAEIRKNMGSFYDNRREAE